MISILRQNFNRLSAVTISSLHCKSDALFYHPLVHFSTSGGGRSVIHPPVYEFLVHKHHFPPKSASEIAAVVARLKNPEESDSVLSFLKESGFSESQLEETVKRYPGLLNAGLEKNVQSKVKVFQDFGLSSTNVAMVLSTNPWIFRENVNRKIIPRLSLLKKLLGPIGESTKLSKCLGWFLKSNLNNTLVPNIELLKNCGVSVDQIFSLIPQFPRLLLIKPEDFKKIVDNVDAMGVNRSSKKFIHAVRLMCSYTRENWELKMRTFREVGFSDDDMAAAFRKAPEVFGLSEETWKVKIRMIRDELGFSGGYIVSAFRNAPSIFGLSEGRIKEAQKVLMANGKYGESCISSFPISLMYSIEKRHKPRMKVLELLESKKLIQSWPPFSTFCHMSNGKFYEKYVAPFSDEIGDAYTVKS